MTGWVRGKSLLAPDPFPAAAEGVLLARVVDAELAAGDEVTELFRAAAAGDGEADLLPGEARSDGGSQGLVFSD